MRAKKKRLRRQVKADLSAKLCPISVTDMLELLKGAEGLEAVRANRVMGILPSVDILAVKP